MPIQFPAQAAAALRQIANGMRASQALYVAAKLNVADHLTRKPMNGFELAAVTGADSAALHRVMRALCALDVFTESSTGQFSLNSTSELLRMTPRGRSVRPSYSWWERSAGAVGRTLSEQFALEAAEPSACLEWDCSISTLYIQRNPRFTTRP